MEITSSSPAGARDVLSEDLRLALLVALLLLVGSGVSLEDDFNLSVTTSDWSSLPGPYTLLLVLAGSLPLTFRRTAPLTVLAATVAASLAYQALGQRPEPLPVGVLVAIYTVAVLRRPFIASAAAAYVVAFTVEAVTGWAPLTDDQFYIDLVSVVATVMVGYGVALGHARATMAEQRTAELARLQEARTQAAVAQEQARIARGSARHRGARRERDGRAGRSRPAGVRRPAAGRRGRLASIEAVGRDTGRPAPSRQPAADRPRAVRPVPGHPRPPAVAARAGRARRSRGDLGHPRRAASVAGDGRAERLSHRAGGADEHPQARRRRTRRSSWTTGRTSCASR